MMDPLEQYYEAVLDTLKRVHEEETEKIREAGRLVGDSLAEGRLLHVMGTGVHSYIGGEEIFYRAGGLVPVNAILDPGLSAQAGANRGTQIERTPGYAQAILKTYPLEPGDVILILNANGINAATIDAALYCKEKGLTVIAITSPECSRAIPAGHPARHPTNQNLCDVADLYIDSKTPLGEALITIEGCDQKVAPASTSINAFIEHSIVAAAVSHMVSVGATPPVWKSANAPGGDAANRQYMEDYSRRVKHL
jgi:uncharacterized phosphosugar-binding protein